MVPLIFFSTETTQAYFNSRQKDIQKYFQSNLMAMAVILLGI
jgi:hypothetical protein